MLDFDFCQFLSFVVNSMSDFNFCAKFEPCISNRSKVMLKWPKFKMAAGGHLGF
jgi:hypothetical protein